MVSSTTPLAPGAPARFGTLDLVSSAQESPLVGATFARPPQTELAGEIVLARRVPTPAVPTPVRVAADHVFTDLSARLPKLLGPNPT
jgi:hypothetical protein